MGASESATTSYILRRTWDGGSPYSWPVLRITRRMLFLVAKAMVSEKSSCVDALTAYDTILPKVQGLGIGVKGSHVSFATAAAIIEDEDTSLKPRLFVRLIVPLESI